LVGGRSSDAISRCVDWADQNCIAIWRSSPTRLPRSQSVWKIGRCASAHSHSSTSADNAWASRWDIQATGCWTMMTFVPS